MRKVIIFVIAAALLMCGCSAQQDSKVVDVTASEQGSDTATPTAKQEPTPMPESTRRPPAKPVTYSGSGDDVIDVAPFEDTLYVFEISGNPDEKHFAVTSYDDAGDYSELLVNTTDKYHGITMDDNFNVARLEVTASGDWSIVQRSVMDMDIIGIGDTYSGTGDSVILVSGRSTTASITGNAGEHHFAVEGYDSQGYYNLLVNTTDKYSGKVMSQNPIVLVITAIGDWEITLN